MEKVARNIMINKAGGNASKSAVNYRISLPAGMVKKLGVTEEDRGVYLEMEDNKIIIKKS